MKKAKETGVGWVTCHGKISTSFTNSLFNLVFILQKVVNVRF